MNRLIEITKEHLVQTLHLLIKYGFVDREFADELLVDQERVTKILYEANWKLRLWNEWQSTSITQ
jgi:hypothetical protein